MSVPIWKVGEVAGWVFDAVLPPGLGRGTLGPSAPPVSAVATRVEERGLTMRTILSMVLSLPAAFAVLVACDQGGSDVQTPSEEIAVESPGQVSWRGRSYRTIVVGRQVWTAENLDDAGPMGTLGSCYGGEKDSCSKYGRLYSWMEATTVSTSEPPPAGRVRGACPVGWHLPSDTEWDTLLEAAGGARVGGAALKSSSGWIAGGEGMDLLGFKGLPAGSRNAEGQYAAAGRNATWWSSTPNAIGTAWNRYLEGTSGSVQRLWEAKELGFSVRCLRDAPAP